VRIRIGEHEVSSFRRFFADAPDDETAGTPFAIWGSAGLLELAVFRDSAARVLGAKRGQSVELKTAAAS
jgi:S-adenosylmethionine hydrolase